AARLPNSIPICTALRLPSACSANKKLEGRIVMCQAIGFRSWLGMRRLQAAALLAMMAYLGSPGSLLAQFLGTNFVTGNADGAVASTSSSTAVGTNAMSGGTFSTALGNSAAAGADSSTALGGGSTARGVDSTADGF